MCRPGFQADAASRRLGADPAVAVTIAETGVQVAVAVRRIASLLGTGSECTSGSRSKQRFVHDVCNSGFRDARRESYIIYGENANSPQDYAESKGTEKITFVHSKSSSANLRLNCQS